MESLNNSLTDISIIKIIIVGIIALFLGVFLDYIFDISIAMDCIAICLILFILFELRKCKGCFKIQANNLFNNFPLKSIIIVVILNIFFSYGMLYLCGFLTDSFPYLETLTYSLTTFNTNIFFVGSLVSSIIIAPIFEELFFRGIIFNKLSKYFSISLGIIISSFLFGICHDFGGIFSAFVFGICMCILYLKTSNILVPIIAHFLNNLLSEAIVLADVNNMLFTDTTIILIFSILAILSACFLFISIIMEWRNFT